MTQLKELIHIPERVHHGDFVLRLTEGVAHADDTLRDYVVTPQLAACFDNALSFIKSALDVNSSKAVYLHGSFGAGKSHFMAVLSLLLAGHVKARSIPALADIVARHNTWTAGRTFLLVPYHMIGARDMESAILGGYAEHIRRLHPEAPIPGFYLAEGLFEDASRLRARLGDTAFFTELNRSAAGAEGWGELGGGWDPVSFEAAMLEPPRGDERMRLVGDLIQHFFTAYAKAASTREEAFVPLDDGLAIMSKHARQLGYDAVILFLDELILWLASRAADVTFVSSEGAKLSKLVEATHADRPIPLVSFIARQRDLRDLVGENLAGSLQLQFQDVLKYWEARFHKITLEDRNLPVIAERRLLQPVSEAAHQTIDHAFHELMNARREVLDTLLTATADPTMFRQVYPFSPALVQTLIAVSSVLQRERTALKLMLQLLVERREEFELGQLIPVGDLFDVIAEGDEPFSDAMRIHFENAKRLYHQKLLPMLERQHSMRWEDVTAGTANLETTRHFKNDARILKTLLLAALVPEVEALKALTAQRLASLNHGTIRSPIPGREAQIVLTKCRQWAAEVGEIKVTEETNPTMAIQVTGVDIEPILANAREHDNPGNRRRKIREILFRELGIEDGSDLFTTYIYAWRGTRREVDVVYENVRELTDERLKGRDTVWTVILDFPFDDPKFTPQDDIARLQRYSGGETLTLIWLPSFLSEKAQKELGTLVILDAILTGERFNDYATHLSQVDRVQARALLKNQQTQLQQRLRQCLEVAYGITRDPRNAIDDLLSPSDQLHSLEPTFRPQPPVGANLKMAFEDLLDQVFSYQYPAHPQFDAEIRWTAVKKVWPEIQKALQTPDGRAYIQDKAVRQLVRSVADPVRLGQTGEAHFVVGQHWRTHFLQKHALKGGTMKVGDLRRWIDEPQPMGLPKEVQNLIIQTFAEQTNRSFYLNGGHFQASLEPLPDELELRETALPAVEDWEVAVHRAGLLFGLTVPQTLNAANASRLITEVTEAVKRARPYLDNLVKTLVQKLQAYEVAPETASRLTTARSALALSVAVAAVEGTAAVAALAGAQVQTSEAAMGALLNRANEIDEAFKNADWPLFDAVGRLTDDRAQAARAIKDRIAEALKADEHAFAIKPVLEDAKHRAIALLTIVPTISSEPAQKAGPPLGVQPVEHGERKELTPQAAKQVLGELGDKLATHSDWRLDLAWTIVKREDRE